jgi:hypothetical protein
MTLDITETLAPASEQLDAIELVAGPRIFEVERVSKGNSEQPIQVYLVDFPRPWRPAKSMRRVLAACWGVDASKWVGRKCELFFDPDVTFGKEKPGGTRISRLSHIDGSKKIPLLVSRGKSAMWTVEPLPDDAPTASPAVSDETLADLISTFRKKGVPEDKWLAGVRHYANATATSLDAITEQQAQTMLAELDKRPDAEANAQAADTDPGDGLFGGEQ